MAGSVGRSVGRVRHWAEERVWRTRPGARWLLRRDLLILDDFRARDTGGVFAAVERSDYSQNGEDGILAYLFDLLGVERGIFVEIGAADGEQNCTRALAESGWTGHWIEGDPELVADARQLPLGGRVQVVPAMVAPDTIVGLLRGAGVPSWFDLLSLDIDSCDFWVMRKVLDAFEPTVLAVEINGEHPWPWVLPLGQGSGADAVGWDHSWNYGASLGAYDAMLSAVGYSLVGCDSQGVNAFFVRTPQLVAAMRLGSWRDHYRPPSHRPGTLGHPRRSPRALSTLDGSDGSPESDEVALSQVHLRAVELIGAPHRRPAERILLLLDVHNDTASTLASSGTHPHRLSYRILDEHSVDVTDGEPVRSRLASAVAPGAVRPSGVEVELPQEPGEYRVLPTVVHEGVAWRAPVHAEGVQIVVADRP